MNISTLFQPVGDVALSGIPPRRFPPFLAVWGGQTEREAAFLNVKLHAARFRVCVGLAAHIGVLLGIGGKRFFKSVLGVRIWINGSFSSNQMSVTFFCLGSPVRINSPFCALVWREGHF